jgi:hypothetical protein
VIIENRSKAVKVLKARERSPLRLFPGYNDCSEIEDIEQYFQNVASKALRKECLTLEKIENLSDDERQDAKKAKEKNNKMNNNLKATTANNSMDPALRQKQDKKSKKKDK